MQIKEIQKRICLVVFFVEILTQEPKTSMQMDRKLLPDLHFLSATWNFYLTTPTISEKKSLESLRVGWNHTMNFSHPGSRSKDRKDPEDLTELHLVKGQ